MLTKESYLKDIIGILSLLEFQVKNLNEINLYDINLLSEDFFAGFFTILFSEKYENINLFEKNATSIDLVCEESKIVVQVTSDVSSTKIKKTITSFIEKKYYEKYEKLVMFFLQPMKNYQTEFDTQNLFELELKDFSSVAEIMRKTDVDILEKLLEYTKKNIYTHLEKEYQITSLYIEDIKEIIDVLHSQKNTVVEELITNNNWDSFPGIKQKNKINNLDEDYFNSAITRDIQNFVKFDEFLSNPRNTEYYDKYDDVATDLRNKFLAMKAHNHAFEQAIINTTDFIIKTDKNIKNKKLVYQLLHYMYCNCDIGINIDDKTS